MLEAEIAAVAHDVWESMFGLQLAPSDAAAVDPPALTGIVHIDGDWQGAVTLRCGVELADDLTRRLFGESTDAEVRDLLGELTNQLGGNIKAMLPGAETLSLPVVAAGSDYEITVSDTTVEAVVALDCDGSPIVVSVLRRSS